ncbi:MAG: hypothetical protein K2H53_00995, partial [Clostridia bacterium]|nr:hypothetical protein [Clostridia bacterium]
MKEETENEMLKNEETKNESTSVKVQEKVEENTKKTKGIKPRTLIVLVAIAVFIIGACMMYRASYLETLEIGEEYVEAFTQNVRYRLYIGVINFVIIFTMVCITNGMIKKGLKKFF